MRGKDYAVKIVVFYLSFIFRLFKTILYLFASFNRMLSVQPIFYLLDTQTNMRTVEQVDRLSCWPQEKTLKLIWSSMAWMHLTLIKKNILYIIRCNCLLHQQQTVLSGSLSDWWQRRLHMENDAHILLDVAAVEQQVRVDVWTNNHKKLF